MSKQSKEAEREMDKFVFGGCRKRELARVRAMLAAQRAAEAQAKEPVDSTKSK